METPLSLSEPTKIRSGRRLLLSIAGAHVSTVAQCPPEDCSTLCARGGLMVGVTLYLAVVFSAVGHKLFAAPHELRPVILLGALSLSAFLLLIDSASSRAALFAEGVKALRQMGGLEIPRDRMDTLKIASSAFIRIGVLAVGLSQLSALAVCILVFGSDIQDFSDLTFRQNNAALYERATAFVDGTIRRATDSWAAQDDRVVVLSKQIASLRAKLVDPASNDQVRGAEQEIQRLLERRASAEDAVGRAEMLVSSERGGIKVPQMTSGLVGAGPRYKAALEQLASAKTLLQKIEADVTAARARLESLVKQLPVQSESVLQRSRDQLAAFEERLQQETAQLTTLKSELAEVTARREQIIRRAVETDAQYAKYDAGFIAQVHVLERLAHEDKVNAMIILALEAVACGLELAGIWARRLFGLVPTTYVLLRARNAYLDAARIAAEMTDAFDAIDRRRRQQAELLVDDPPAAEQPPPNQNPPEPQTTANDAPEPPLKRKRGRPRKTPLPDQPATGLNGQRNTESPVAPIGPA